MAHVNGTEGLFIRCFYRSPLSLQDFAVKWVRSMPERYHALAAADDGLITEI
jgi:hypothetical protein